MHLNQIKGQKVCPNLSVVQLSIDIFIGAMWFLFNSYVSAGIKMEQLYTI